jgi:hypothetical protein
MGPVFPNLVFEISNTLYKAAVTINWLFGDLLSTCQVAGGQLNHFSSDFYLSDYF